MLIGMTRTVAVWCSVQWTVRGKLTADANELVVIAATIVPTAVIG